VHRIGVELGNIGPFWGPNYPKLHEIMRIVVLKIKNKGRTSYFEVENEEQGAKPVKRSYFY
jgi:hypothetical protein